MRPGLSIYCDSHDVSPRYRAQTLATLRRAGAVGAVAMVEGITGDRGSHLASLDDVRAMVDACGDHDITVTASAFPDVREPHERSRDHLTTCLSVGCAALELDAEPRAGVHWTPVLVAPWLALSPLLTLTTTRIEAEHIGYVGGMVRGQLEQLTSVDTLTDALRRLSACTMRASIQPVLGAFDQRRVVRTVAMMRRDLERCTEQARASGGLAVWAAHSISHAEADSLREWALATWAA